MEVELPVRNGHQNEEEAIFAIGVKPEHVEEVNGHGKADGTAVTGAEARLGMVDWYVQRCWIRCGHIFICIKKYRGLELWLGGFLLLPNKWYVRLSTRY